MDFLEESFGAGQEKPVSLEELMPVETYSVPAPFHSIRNRAATTALLTANPEKAIDNYRLMMLEGESGDSAAYKQMQEGILKETKQSDMRGLLNILADKNIPIEKKQAAVEGMRKSQFLNDSGTILHSKMLAEGSRGETYENEDARLSTADAIREIYEARNEIQGLMNAHMARLDSVNAETVVDLAALWVLPFGNNVSTGKVSKGLAELEGKPLSTWQTIKNFLLPGNTMASMRERLESIPPEQRVEFTRKVLEAIQENSGIIFSNDNQFAQYEKARELIEDGGYNGFIQFVDNVSPLLDAIGIGQFARGFAKGYKGAAQAAKEEGKAASKARRPGSMGPDIEDITSYTETKKKKGVPFAPQIDSGVKRLTYEPEDQLRRIEMNVIRQENPASPANIVQTANPQKAREFHSAAFMDESGEFAEATYGVKREQAMANDVFPQAATESGAVRSKVPDIEAELRETLRKEIDNTGAIYFTPAEKAAVQAQKVNEFTSAEGLSMNPAMSIFSLDGSKVRIGAVYGTPNGSFLRAEDAVAQAKVALRKQGISDDEITVLRREGLDHVPVKLEDVKGVDGDYLIRIDTSHEIGADDIANWDKFDVRRNVFDRVPGFTWEHQGSVSRWMMDAASMLHPIYTGAASVVSDATAKFDKLMLGLASDYSDKFMKFPAARKAKIDDYIREANYNGIAFDRADLVARGFDPDEISALKSWRDFWDGHFYLENYDVVRTLNAQGFQKFKNPNAELFAKPIEKNGNIGKVYDPALDKVIPVVRTEMDALYASGGTYAKLRRPVDFAGETAEYMMVRNTPTEYLRKIRDTDQVLNYRNGYFQIQYKAPRFVEEITRDTAGAIIERKAVAVAGDTPEAERFKQRMAAANGKEYQIRGDDRALRKSDDAYWDLESASGRIAQRHRGQLLEDAAGLNHLGDGSYILNPVDSAQQAARSIAGRTVARPMLEAAKGRAIAQYGDMFPTNGMGGRRWPKSVGEIVDKGNPTSKRVADARTTYEYINYLENGYINVLDEGFRGVMNATAEMLGKAGMGTAERAATAIGDIRPTSAAKNAVFMSYIGTNFLRQWIIQPHQVVRTWAYNPTGWLSGRIEMNLADFIGDLTGVKSATRAEGKEFIDFVKQSGLLDAVDKNNLVRGSLLEAADSTNKVARRLGKMVEVPRKFGFDIGEQANLLGHSAAVFDRYKKAGKNLSDKAVRDEAYSEIRALSYDMNFAGDMPYNQTAPAMLLQFMQVPHKALLQLTNRRLSKTDRLRLAAADLTLWGAPTVLIADVLGVDVLPDDENLRELITWGAEAMLLNEMFSIITGEEQGVDVSSLAPYEMSGWMKFFEAMYSGGFDQLLMNSPAGQLLLKDGGRTQNFIATMGRFYSGFSDEGEDVTTFLNVLDEGLKISSGWNNVQKARVALAARKKFDQYGNVTDDDVTKFEAMMQVFGFGTITTREMYAASKAMSDDVKKHKEDVLSVYNDVRRYYYNKLEDESTDAEFIQKVTGRLMDIYSDDAEAMRIIQNQLKMDLQGKDQQLLKLFMKRAGIPDVGGLRDQISRMPVSEEEKALMNQILEDTANARKTLKEKE